METSPAPRGEELLAHGRFLRSLARGLVGDPARAEELVQETWAVALAHPPRHARGLRAWLAQILRRLHVKRGLREAERGARERVAHESRFERAAALDDDPPAIAAEIELSRRVLECVERLREPYRSTIYLRYYRDLPPQHIAAEQRVPVKTVKTRLSRGLELLREDLDRLHAGRREAWVALLLPVARGAPPLPVGAAPAATAAASVAVALGSTALVAAAVWGALFLARDGARGAEPVPPGPAPLASSQPARLGDAREERGRSAVPGRDARPGPAAELVRLRGRVCDAAGEPLAGAEVAAALTELERPGPPRGAGLHGFGAGRALQPDVEEPVSARTSSDGTGEFELVLPASGLVRLGVERDGFAPHGRRLLAFLGQELELGTIALEPGVFLSGRVLDEDGAPLPGAELWQERIDEGLAFGPGPRAELVARADGNGRFELARVAAGPWSLEARAPEHAPAVLAGETGFAGERVQGLELVLARGAAIEGRVVGLAPADLPRAGVIARSRGPREPRESRGGDLLQAPLDERGEFRLGGLAPGEERELVVVLEGAGGMRRARGASEPLLARAGEGPVELVAREPERRPDRRGEPVEASAEAAPAVEPGSAVVEVLVRRPDGTPAAGALVALRAGSSAGNRPHRPDAIRAADREGRVRWDELAPGRHELCVVAGVFGLGGGGEEAWSPVEVAADSAATLELTSEPRAALAGRVRVLGVPLAGAQVLVRPASLRERRGGGLALTARSDGEGRFAFQDLPPGDYRVEVLHSSRAVPARETVALSASGAELAFELDDARLAGLVRDHVGRPIAGAQVSIVREEEPEPGELLALRRPGAAGRVLTDASGRFELGGLDPRTALALELSAPGRATLRAGPALPGSFQELVLFPEARLTLELVSDARPFLLLVARDAAGRTRAFELPAGRATELAGLAPGTWQLELHARPPRRERDSTLLETRAVELDVANPTALRWLVP